MTRLGEEIWQLISKSGIYICITILAIVGKLGMDLMNKKTPSPLYIIGFTCVALFVAVMAFLACAHQQYSPTVSAIIVGASAMFSRDILVLSKLIAWRKIASLNWRDLLEILITKKTK